MTTDLLGAVAEASEVLRLSAGPLELMGELLAADRSFPVDGEVEALRRTARAAFEDWFEARGRAEVRRREITEIRGRACSDVGHGS